MKTKKHLGLAPGARARVPLAASLSTEVFTCEWAELTKRAQPLRPALDRSPLLAGLKSEPASWGLYFAEGTENQNLIFAFKANNYAAIMLINATACLTGRIYPVR